MHNRIYYGPLPAHTYHIEREEAQMAQLGLMIACTEGLAR
jgi:hypothetical protein